MLTTKSLSSLLCVHTAETEKENLANVRLKNNRHLFNGCSKVEVTFKPTAAATSLLSVAIYNLMKAERTVHPKIVDLVIRYTSLYWWKVGISFVIQKTFLKLYSKTPLQQKKILTYILFKAKFGFSRLPEPWMTPDRLYGVISFSVFRLFWLQLFGWMLRCCFILKLQKCFVTWSESLHSSNWALERQQWIPTLRPSRRVAGCVSSPF